MSPLTMSRGHSVARRVIPPEIPFCYVWGSSRKNAWRSSSSVFRDHAARIWSDTLELYSNLERCSSPTLACRPKRSVNFSSLEHRRCSGLRSRTRRGELRNTTPWCPHTSVAAERTTTTPQIIARSAAARLSTSAAVGSLKLRSTTDAPGAAACWTAANKRWR